MTEGVSGWESIPAMVADIATRHSDRLAVLDGETRRTYAELHEDARNFAGALVASGVRPGDRVAVWAPNCHEWIVSLLGLLHAGAVLVPINTRFKGNEAAVILARSRAKVLLTVTDFLGTDYLAMLSDAGVDLPDLDTVVVAHGDAPADGESWSSFLGRATDADRAEADRRAGALTAEDPSDILFTSGTTGVPKGVVMTHGRTLTVATDWVQMTGMGAGDRYLMVNPYFHMFGLKSGILASVAAAVTMLPEPVFDVDRVLERVATEKITVLPGPPTLYQSILEHPERDRYDVSTLRVAVTGAADIPVELIRRIEAELPFEVLVTGYGLTEGGTVSATGPDDDVETIATTVGRPRPGYEVRVVEAGGETDLEPGETGEVLVRSATVMLGYLDDPEATAAVISPDGWLHTGDLGVIDERGCLRIVGRSKDMFIVGGFNAYPAEIENALLRHPDVAQVAVIGIPDARLGEVGMAFVVTRSGNAEVADEIIAWSREQMANYKVPRAVEVVDSLPVNATGKVVKDELRARVAARQEAVTS